MRTREFVTVAHPGNLRTGCQMGKPVRSVPRKSPLTILTNLKRLTMELHITGYEYYNSPLKDDQFDLSRLLERNLRSPYVTNS